MAAGASMIHPNVPAIMITPICPHSLSFRPIVVPAGVELKVCTSTVCNYRMKKSHFIFSVIKKNQCSLCDLSVFIACLFSVDNALSGCQKHSLGVLRWKEETRDLPRRQVRPHTCWSSHLSHTNSMQSQANEAKHADSVMDNKFNWSSSCLNTCRLCYVTLSTC